MGTRALTRVYDSWNEDRGNILVNLYRQYDGYPDCHGKELSEFLDGREIVNGIRSDYVGKISNGVECLAAQLVSCFKDVDTPGNFYLYPTDETNCGQDYMYEIFVNNKLEIKISVISYGDVIFEGNTKEFKYFCKKY